MVDLRGHLTDDNLVRTSSLQWDSDRLLLLPLAEQVYVAPRAMGVVHYLKTRNKLWECAEIKVTPTRGCFLGACIFGVPFEKALALLTMDDSKEPIIKSQFKRTDEQEIVDCHLGMVSTLVAHASREYVNDDTHVTLEAWQLIGADSDTYYIHGIFSRNKNAWIHFDGATMSHSMDEKRSLCERAIKSKGADYTKYFRLDGELPTCDVAAIANAFFPLTDLTQEYLRKSCLPSIRAAGPAGE